ncbi:MAG: hypothetical protein FWG15_02845 [Propionibacteriaceae bacterium]|nr:hypothetical protein [Propionibacteriaceae bacterium]
MSTSDLLLPGYWIDKASGAWCSVPWPVGDEKKSKDARHLLASMSLGPAIIDWAEGRTDEPGLIHPISGRRWVFTPGQKRFLVLWYLVNEEGRFVYRSGVKRGSKGSGKDPMAGALANAELCGPVEFAGFVGGRPVGVRRGLPLVQIASNSEEQSKDLLRVANAMWSKAAREFYGLDVGATRTVVKDTGGRFEVTTASEASSEGDPVTAGIMNESHHMTESSGGKKLAAVARRNAAKSPSQIQARVIEFTNAHMPGMGSVAEDSFEAWQKQQALGYPGALDILYDSIEAPPDTDVLTAKGRMRGLKAAYMDAPWADLPRLSDEMLDPRTSVADAIRYYLNGLATEEDAWVDAAKFDALASQFLIEDDTPVALFLDCSKSEDATALIGCTLDYRVFEVGVWERPKGPRGMGWLVPREDVDSAVRDALNRYKVQWFGIDPGPAKDGDDEALYWAYMIDGLARDYRDSLPLWASPGVGGSPVLFDMRHSTSGSRKRNFDFTKTAELLQSWIDQEGESSPLRWDGSPTLRRHVHNAKARPNLYGTSLGKVTRDSSKTVDAATSMVGAVMGARLAGIAKTKTDAPKYAPGQGRMGYTTTMPTERRGGEAESIQQATRDFSPRLKKGGS